MATDLIFFYRVVLTAVTVILSLGWSTASGAAESRWGVRVGQGFMYETSNNARSEDLKLPILVGAGIEWARTASRIVLGLEYSRFRSSDGNETVAVSRVVENAFVWGDVSFARDGRIVPYLGAGFGASRLTAETRLGAQTDSSSGAWASIAALRVGIASAWSSSLQLLTEVRYETGQNIKTNDARSGIVFNLQYFFGKI